MNQPSQGVAQLRRVIRDSGVASVIALSIGGVTTALLLRDAGIAAFARLQWRGGTTWLLAALLMASAANFAGRFVRWQYLLRTCGVLLPTRESARLFFSSFAVLLVPLYLGEIIFKAFFLRRRRGTDIGVTAAVAIAERLHDAVTMMVIAGVAGLWMGHRTRWLLVAVAVVLLPRVRTGLGVLAAWPVAVAGRLFLNADTRPARRAMRDLARPQVAGLALLLSVLSWLPVALSLSLAGAALETPVGVADGARLFSSAALVGGLSLLPAGVAIAGHTMLRGLVTLGVAFPVGVAAVAIVRLSTLGMAIVVGVGMLLWSAWCGEFVDTGAHAHFDRVSEVYDAEIPLHVREYLVRKKADLIAAGLNGKCIRGLDLGCGRGYYLDEFRRRSYAVFGVDLSTAQLGTPRTAGVAVAGDALRLPFADGTFDFVYSVNLFHHLPSRELQRQALQEARRVLRLGGMFFLHEINVVNPLFRFYMGYVFPVIRNIDSGTERWLKPAALGSQPGLRLCSVRYFTFIPDFLPRWALGWARELEERLERSRWAQFSAHFVAGFERT